MDFGLGAVLGFWLIGGIIGLAVTVFWIVEIIDVIRREFADSTLKIVWLLVVIFLHFIGALVYYFLGKPQGRLPNSQY